MKILISLLLLYTLITGCSPDKEYDTTPPVITFNTPTTGQVYTSGQSIIISGSVTDNIYISEFHIHVTNTNTNTLLMDIHKFPASNTMTFSESITAVAGVNYKIQAIALDKDINEGKASTTASCN